MGQCKYCGENAGLFKNAHKECTVRHDAGWSQMVSISTDAARGNSTVEDLISTLGSIAESSRVPTTGIRESLVKGWENAVNQALDDNILAVEEEEKLTEYTERFSLSQGDLDENGAYTRMVEASVIREVLEGNVPSRVNVQGVMPFNLQKSESLVWVFQDVPYYETRTRRERVGSYRGASIRVMKGVYYHTGGFRGHSVERISTEYADTGMLGITNKHIYFSGNNKKFRVPYSKIVTFEPYSDGLGIMRDAASAKPQTFITGDGWFIYNLVANLAQT